MANPSPRRHSPHPSSMSVSDCVLLLADGFPGRSIHCNGTTASAVTSCDFSIQVSLSCPERPLIPTILFVRCPEIDFSSEPPNIVRAVENLILLRVLVGPPPRYVSPEHHDYFVYRPGGRKGPSLELLERPHPTFHDEDVGLLPRGDEHYTVAALLATGTLGVYDLHRFDSGTRAWSQVKVRLVDPQVSFPCKIPIDSDRLLYHHTSTVIAIGGEGGTMGWVDLWSGILLCDVLREEPSLRGVPVPLPLELLRFNGGRVADLGCPEFLRGIALIDKPGTEACLRFVHLEANASQIPPPAESDEETGFRDWTITTWSYHRMSTSWEDWEMDRKVKASHTYISSKLKSKMRYSELLSPRGAEPQSERALHNLLVSHPAPGIDGDVVYLQARLKFLDPKAFVLALDTRTNTLLGAAEFATERKRGAGIVYFPCNVSRYIDPKDRVLRMPKGDEDGSSLEESSRYEGTECLEFVGAGLQISFFSRDGPSLEEGLDVASLAN